MRESPLMKKTLVVLLAAVAATMPVSAQELSADVRGRIDQAVNEVLATTGAPSASIAVVQDGRVIYTHAYGKAQLDTSIPGTPLPGTGKAATSEMRYSIGS